MSFCRCQPAIYCLLPKKVGVRAGSVKRDCFLLNGEYQKPVRLYVTLAVTFPVRCEIMRPALFRRSAAPFGARKPVSPVFIIDARVSLKK